MDHCLKSNAGLFYADRHEFVECLNLLMADERLRAAMGRNGRDYVRHNYRWDVIMAKYERMIAKVKEAAEQASGKAGVVTTAGGWANRGPPMAVHSVSRSSFSVLSSTSVSPRLPDVLLVPLAAARAGCRSA